MYERSYGEKYDGSLSTTEIAKLIRADIKVAVAAGELPGKPVTYSVRSEYFSMGSSIDVEVRNYAGPVEEQGFGRPWMTQEAGAIKARLEAISGAYNHDGSDIQVDYFDVNYYGHVTFEASARARYNERSNAS